MARDRRSIETITALLSTAPALTPVAETEDRAGGSNLLPVKAPDLPATHEIAGPPAKNPSFSPGGEVEYDEVDLEAFELEVDRPLVRPRRRKEVDYQTLRVNQATARIARQCWLAARQQDPLTSFTEFATIVVQRGLRALAEDRAREEPDLFGRPES